MPHAQRPVVLVAGAGVAALEALLALRVLAGPAIDLEWLAPGTEFVYRPMAVVEPFGRGEARRIPLARVAEDQSLRLHQGALAEVDPERPYAVADDGRRLACDALVVALGASPVPAVPGAITFAGPEEAAEVRRALGDLQAGRARSIAFAMPSGASWPLPLYELALMTENHLRAAGADEVEITIVTPEARPLEMFGPGASADLDSLLAARDIRVRALCIPRDVVDGRLRLEGGGSVSAQRAVALPRLRGPAIPGLPSDDAGFVPTDEHGRVVGTTAVYAAGDCTAFPLKQGGLATQQADAVASAIAATMGVPGEPEPFRPMLRGLLLTGSTPRYLRADPTRLGAEATVAIEAPARRRRAEHATEVAHRALWWPPAKIAGRYLAPYLADARPVPLGSAPLADRPVPARPADPHDDDERHDAAEMALILADGDARFGDYSTALRALEAAESLAGSLPPEYAEKRRIWREELRGGRLNA